MQEFVEYIIKSLIDSGAEVKVELEDDKFIVTLPRSEMGKVIGRQGKIVKAIRTIVRGAGMKDGRAYGVEIVEMQ
ncbi:MAG: KH domain-containing protein [Firmicutes bacterium]|nr:KH domain-containing protein [Bacillota bacterium]